MSSSALQAISINSAGWASRVTPIRLPPSSWLSWPDSDDQK
ncbi:hypothetical protein AMP9_1150 [plant metagenome]|uniref:Uncharacterized protein n=1 Tax=plant metagenome TaxID=1297885 RepID=A0A484NRU1_9ZZZZ